MSFSVQELESAGWKCVAETTQRSTIWSMCQRTFTSCENPSGAFRKGRKWFEPVELVFKCEVREQRLLYSIHDSLPKLGVVFPHQNFFPWGMGKNGEGIIFSHGEMGKNGESYFGFKLTKNGIKSTLFEFRAYFLRTEHNSSEQMFMQYF